MLVRYNFAICNRCWILVTRCSMLDAGCWILGGRRYRVEALRYSAKQQWDARNAMSLAHKY